MTRIASAASSAAILLLAACGTGAEHDGRGDLEAATQGAPGGGPIDVGDALPLDARADDLALDLHAQGSATSDVKALRLAPRKIAFHFGRPTEPLFDGVAGEPVPCHANAGTFVRGAPPDASVEFGAADTRLRLASIDLARGVLLVEAWILVERGSAGVERPGGQVRALRLPVCRDDDGAIWSVVRAVPPRPFVVTEDAGATATIDLRASAFIVEPASCAGSDAPAECASDDDEGDDGDPGTRLVYTLHSLSIRAGP